MADAEGVQEQLQGQHPLDPPKGCTCPDPYGEQVPGNPEFSPTCPVHAVGSQSTPHSPERCPCGGDDCITYQQWRAEQEKSGLLPPTPPDAPDLSGRCCQCDNPLANGGHANCQRAARQALERMATALRVIDDANFDHLCNGEGHPNSEHDRNACAECAAVHALREALK